jgi:hypothetical protein
MIDIPVPAALTTSSDGHAAPFVAVGSMSNVRTTIVTDKTTPGYWRVTLDNRKHPAISSGFLFLGVRAYVSTILGRPQ